MKLGQLAIAAAALGFAFTPGPAKAQGPMWDKVQVNLPYSVSVGDRTLPPGDYTIEQVHSEDKSPVLLIYSDNGMRFETSAMTISALDPNTPPEKTSVVLGRLGQDYYFDKIWIQGKNYGYEFPVPARVRERQEERQQVTVAGQYQPVQRDTAQNTPTPAQPAPQPAPAPEVAPAPAPAPAVETQSTPPPAQPEAAPAPAPAAGSEANREMPSSEANREMPATSAGWVMMLLGGGTLSGLGLALRRKQ